MRTVAHPDYPFGSVRGNFGGADAHLGPACQPGASCALCGARATFHCMGCDRPICWGCWWPRKVGFDLIPGHMHNANAVLPFDIASADGTLVVIGKEVAA